MKLGVIAGLLIVSVILLSMPIALAQEGMWHSAGEVGPGTFLPGLYKWDQDSQIDFSSDMDGDSFEMKFPASETTGLNIETTGKNTALMVTALGTNARAAIFSGKVRIIGDLTTVGGDIVAGGAIVAGGVVCDGAGNCLHSVSGGTGGGGDNDWIMYGGNIYRDTGKVNIGIAYTDPSYWSPSQLNVMEDITSYGKIYAEEFCVDATGGGDYDCTTSWGTGSGGTTGGGGITLDDVENHNFVSLTASKFIDADNPNYYTDPSSASKLQGLEVAGDLAVSGDGTVKGGLLVGPDGSGNYGLVVDEASGNVGIGTGANPPAALYIVPSGNGLRLDAPWGEDRPLDIRTRQIYGSNQVTRLMVDWKGFTGVGTTTPSVGLQVGVGTPAHISSWVSGDPLSEINEVRYNAYVKGDFEVGGSAYLIGDLEVGNDVSAEKLSAGEICIGGYCRSEWLWVPERIQISNMAHDGDFGGYNEMNAWIQTHGCEGYHVCDGTEITRYLQNNGIIYGQDPSKTRVWYISGIYSMRDNDVDVIRDCNGWDDPLPEYGHTKADWGPVWRFDTDDGRPGTALCEESYPVMCCI